MKVDARSVRGDYHSLTAALERACWVDRLVIVGECPSTNTLALELSEPGGVVLVVAESQSAGRGRRGAQWRDLPGASALCSFAWRSSPADADALGLLSLAGGIAATLACRSLGARAAGAKWPNDIWSRKRKLGGVLTESQVKGSAVASVVVGIGINVRAAPPIEGEGGVLPTCLCEEGAPDAEPPATIAAIACQMSHLVSPEGEPCSSKILDGWAHVDLLRGQRVAATTPGGLVEGTAEGIDPAGRLRIRMDHGEMAVLTSAAARVRLVDRASYSDDGSPSSSAF